MRLVSYGFAQSGFKKLVRFGGGMANNKAIVDKPGYSKKRKSNKEALKVLYCNARSIRNKMDELRGVIAMEGFDIIGITESWANSNDVPNFF